MKKILVLVGLVISGIAYGQQTFNIGGSNNGYSRTQLRTIGLSDINWRNLINTPYVNIEDYGAIGSDNLSDTSAFRSALAFACTNNLILFIPKGVFIVDGITISDTVQIMGTGNKSILKNTTTGAMITIGADECRFSNFAIYGDGYGNGKTTQIGITTVNNHRFVIDNVYFYNSDGYGVFMNGKSGDIAPYYGIDIKNCISNKVRVAICSNNDNQYLTVSNCNLFDGGWGLFLVAGNFSIINCNITNNTTGIYVYDSGNDAHSNIIGGKINHNTTNIYVREIDLGLNFTGVQTHQGVIYLRNTVNVTFTGCELGTIDFRFEASKATSFVGCILYNTTAIQDNFNTTTSYTSWIGTSTIGVNDAALSSITPYISAALTDDAPTDTEIDTATGLTPATAKSGYQSKIKDSNGSGLVYTIWSDGTAWHYSKSTIAVDP